MPGDGVGERPFINLKRRDAEIEIGGATFALRDFSSVAWRREQYSAVIQEAFALYQQLTHAFAHIQYSSIPLMPVMQRHITEALVEALTQVKGLQPFFEQHKPKVVVVRNVYAASVAQLAAQRTLSKTTVQQITPLLSLAGYRHVAESVVRNALYVPRIYSQRKHKLSISPISSDRHRLLFLSYYPNHLPSFLPLIEKLQATGNYDIWVSGADTNTLRRGDIDPTPLFKMGIPYLPFEAAISWSKLLRSMALSVRLTAKIGREIQQDGYWQSLHNDTPLRMLVKTVLTNLLETRLPKILLYLDLAEALHHALCPTLAIVSDETLPVLGRVALGAAQKQQIPTLTIQHGLLLDDPMYYGPSVADCFAVWGTFSHDFLVAHGCPPEKLALVGSTRFNSRDISLYPADLPALLNLPPETNIILFTSQPGGRDVSPQENKATFVALATAIAQLPKAHLLVKPHPAQTDFELANWQQACPNVPVSIRRDLPLHPIMLGASLNVTVFSTTGLEALWLDRPLLTINLTDRPDLIPYAASGAAVAAYNAEDVLPALQLALDPIDQQKRAVARRKFVESYLGVQDGRALDRLVALIEEMVS